MAGVAPHILHKQLHEWHVRNTSQPFESPILDSLHIHSQYQIFNVSLNQEVSGGQLSLGAISLWNRTDPAPHLLLRGNQELSQLHSHNICFVLSKPLWINNWNIQIGI